MSDKNPQPQATKRSEASNTRAVVFGSAVSGIAGYAFSIIAARTVSEQDYALIGLLWTLQYLLISVGLLNVEAWIAKTGELSRSIWTYIAVGCLIFAALGTYSGFTVFGESTQYVPVFLTSLAIAIAYGLLIVKRGILAHQQEFGHFGLLNAAESSLRLLFTVVVTFLLVMPNLTVYTMALGPLVAVGLSQLWIWYASRSNPTVTVEVMPSTEGSSVHYFAATAFANGASQFLLAGGPILAAAIHAQPEVVSLIFVTITLGRAPLVFVHGGLLARIIPPLQRLAQLNDRQQLISTVKPFVWLTIGALPAAFIGGWFVGPPIIALAYGEALRPSPLFAALTGVSVIGTMAALLFGQLMIAFSQERQLVLPWASGLIIAATVFVIMAGYGAVIATSLAGCAGIVATTTLLMSKIMSPQFTS